MPIRSAQRWSRGAERDAEVRDDAGPRTFSGSLLISKADGADHRYQLRTARVNVRAAVRTNGERRHKLSTLGHFSRPTNPSVCGTQAKGCFRGPGPPNDLAHWAGPLLVCRSLSNGMRDARLATGRPRKRPFANAFRTAPFGQEGTESNGLPCGRTEHGSIWNAVARRAKAADARLRTCVGLFDN